MSKLKKIRSKLTVKNGKSNEMGTNDEFNLFTSRGNSKE